jgi:hypothetical protein
MALSFFVFAYVIPLSKTAAKFVKEAVFPLSFENYLIVVTANAVVPTV